MRSFYFRLKANFLFTLKLRSYFLRNRKTGLLFFLTKTSNVFLWKHCVHFSSSLFLHWFLRQIDNPSTLTFVVIVVSQPFFFVASLQHANCIPAELPLLQAIIRLHAVLLFLKLIFPLSHFLTLFLFLSITILLPFFRITTQNVLSFLSLFYHVSVWNRLFVYTHSTNNNKS